MVKFACCLSKASDPHETRCQGRNISFFKARRLGIQEVPDASHHREYYRERQNSGPTALETRLLPLGQCLLFFSVWNHDQQKYLSRECDARFVRRCSLSMHHESICWAPDAQMCNQKGFANALSNVTHLDVPNPSEVAHAKSYS